MIIAHIESAKGASRSGYVIDVNLVCWLVKARWMSQHGLSAFLAQATLTASCEGAWWPPDHEVLQQGLSLRWTVMVSDGTVCSLSDCCELSVLHFEDGDQLKSRKKFDLSFCQVSWKLQKVSKFKSQLSNDKRKSLEISQSKLDWTYSHSLYLKLNPSM